MKPRLRVLAQPTQTDNTRTHTDYSQTTRRLSPEDVHRHLPSDFLLPRNPGRSSDEEGSPRERAGLPGQPRLAGRRPGEKNPRRGREAKTLRRQPHVAGRQRDGGAEDGEAPSGEPHLAGRRSGQEDGEAPSGEPHLAGRRPGQEDGGETKMSSPRD